MLYKIFDNVKNFDCINDTCSQKLRLKFKHKNKRIDFYSPKWYFNQKTIFLIIKLNEKSNIYSKLANN